ncbi:MAG: MBL fold metallo-hydrolase [Melioribacteraceae bacterium]|nr:MBL fold metallo-hydrolase [Melioribacteraceae bacterium]MCF8355192.1 MBL fold metallo-hydrolase [Melioribacteraceae bacterium]MCF8395405.1 MBL fold metallo-hydrolase [Melioribacteraceae bacterium]MCF8419889.1 MBL fold metallo-hydrolase [Melioribacteraceae bacterium]
MLKIKKFVFSNFYENTYILWDELSKDTAIVDPGCLEETEQSQLSEFISENFLKVKFLINTHCHIDHVFGNAYVKDKYNPIFIAPEKDIPLLQNMEEQARMFGMEVIKSPLPDEFIDPDKKILLGKIELKFIFTPGHTPGEYCIYFEKDKICITGDVLFYEGIGRTDLWGGDFNTLINSIKNELLKLPEDVTIYPGHGENSTIGHEKKHNPFL